MIEDFERIHLTDKIFLGEETILLWDQLLEEENRKFANYVRGNKKKSRIIQQRANVQSIVRAGKDLFGGENRPKFIIPVRGIRGRQRFNEISRRSKVSNLETNPIKKRLYQ